MENAIKELRHKRIPKITQLELAKEIGVSESMVCQYEAGLKNPSLKTLMKLTKGFSKLLEKSITINDIIRSPT